jgi:hypothetical protein
MPASSIYFDEESLTLFAFQKLTNDNEDENPAPCSPMV